MHWFPYTNSIYIKGVLFENPKWSVLGTWYIAYGKKDKILALPEQWSQKLSSFVGKHNKELRYHPLATAY